MVRAEGHVHGNGRVGHGRVFVGACRVGDGKRGEEIHRHARGAHVPSLSRRAREAHCIRIAVRRGGVIGGRLAGKGCESEGIGVHQRRSQSPAVEALWGHVAALPVVSVHRHPVSQVSILAALVAALTWERRCGISLTCVGGPGQRAYLPTLELGRREIFGGSG